MTEFPEVKKRRRKQERRLMVYRNQTEADCCKRGDNFCINAGEYCALPHLNLSLKSA